MDMNSRGGFLTLGGLVEGGTILLAIAVAWLTGTDPWGHLSVSWPVVLIGLAGTVPMFAIYRFARGTRSIAVELMGDPLSRCRWYDLILLAAMAGLGEELLFRGVLQPWMSGWSPLFGLIGANILFGLVHFVTPVYALLAMSIGMYLSGIAYGLSQGNLLSAMIAHGVYDYIAFHLIIREHRAGLAMEASSNSAAQTE